MSSNQYIPSNNTKWRLIGTPDLDIKIDKKWKNKYQLRKEYMQLKLNSNHKQYLENDEFNNNDEDNNKSEKFISNDEIINNQEYKNNYLNTAGFNSELEKLRHRII